MGTTIIVSLCAILSHICKLDRHCLHVPCCILLHVHAQLIQPPPSQPLSSYTQVYVILFRGIAWQFSMCRPSREKINIVDSDHPKHATQAYPDRHFSPPVDCFRNHSSIYPPLDGMCRPDQSARTAQADLVDILRRCVSPQLHFGAFLEKMCTVPKGSYVPTFYKP